MRFLLIFAAAFIIGACGGEDGDSAKSRESGMAEKTGSMEKTAKSEMKEGMRVVDHTMDEAEFELKRSINGLERMIAQYKEEGFDYSELEKKKEKLMKELENL